MGPQAPMLPLPPPPADELEWSAGISINHSPCQLSESRSEGLFITPVCTYRQLRRPLMLSGTVRSIVRRDTPPGVRSTGSLVFSSRQAVERQGQYTIRYSTNPTVVVPLIR